MSALNILRKIFFSKLPQKFIALLLAVIAWWLFLQNTQNTGLVVYPVKVVYADIPKHLTLVDDLVDSVNVTFDIDKLKYQDLENLRLVVNMKETSAGDNIYKLSKKNLVGPRYNVVSFEPSSLNIKLDHLIMKKFKIVPKFDGTDILKNDNIKVVPKTAFISGPRSVLSGIKDITTTTIEQKLLEKNLVLKTNLDLPKFTRSANNTEFMVYLEKIIEP